MISTPRRSRRRKWRRDEIRVIDPTATRRSIAGTAIGNFMEWYDFGLYGYIATTIAQVFYPGNSVTANGGTIKLEDTPGGGLTVVLQFPGTALYEGANPAG